MDRRHWRVAENMDTAILVCAHREAGGHGNTVTPQCRGGHLPRCLRGDHGLHNCKLRTSVGQDTVDVPAELEVLIPQELSDSKGTLRVSGFVSCLVLVVLVVIVPAVDVAHQKGRLEGAGSDHRGLALHGGSAHIVGRSSRRSSCSGDDTTPLIRRPLYGHGSAWRAGRWRMCRLLWRRLKG
jgi:hypothetical protein